MNLHEPALPTEVLDFLANQSSPSTVNVYRREILAFLNLSQKPLTKVSTHDLVRYRASLRCNKPATVCRKLSTIRSLFRFMVEGGYSDHNPALALKLPKNPNTSPYRILSAAELTTMLSKTDQSTPIGARDRAMLLLLAVNALRESEFTGLDIEDLSPRSSCVLTVIRGKGSKVRVAKISGAVLDALEVWRRYHTAKSGPLFVSVRSARPSSTRMSQRSVRYRVKHYALAAGITRRVSPHALRHAAISHSLANGANILKVKELAGHASLTTTQRYLHSIDVLNDNATDYSPLINYRSS